MTKVGELHALAERCEQAMGPDRELDFAIAQQFGVTVWLRNDDDSANYETTHWHYSSSIDAAMTLMPDHSRFGLYRCRDWGDNTSRAWVHSADHSYCEDEPNEELRCSAQAATPALALCAAALRARASA